MDWERYSYVIASKYRKKILLTLKERPKTPTEIKNETGYYLSHVSTVLNEMEKNEVISCLTPNRKKGKLYTPTEQGFQFLEYINQHSS